MTSAVLGDATLQGLAGWLAAGYGLETIGPFLVAACAALLLLHAITIRLRISPGRIEGPRST